MIRSGQWTMSRSNISQLSIRSFNGWRATLLTDGNQRPRVPDDVATRWRRFCQSRFLSDNMASSTPWLHSLAFNNCSPLPAPLHDIFARSSLAYWLSVSFASPLWPLSWFVPLWSYIQDTLTNNCSTAPKPHWAPPSENLDNSKEGNQWILLEKQYWTWGM